LIPDASATDDGVCTGTVTLSFTSSGSVTAASNQTLTGAVFGIGTSTIIWKATDNCSSTTTCSFSVTVYGPLTPGSINTGGGNFCVGGNTNIGGTSAPYGPATGGNPPLVYQWEESYQAGPGCSGTWAIASGVNNGTSYDPPGFASPGTYCYRRKVTDGCGNSVYSGTATFNVYADPVSQTINPSPASPVCEGTNISATFSGGSGGIPGTNDIYEYSTNSGSTWLPYTSGNSISTTGLSGANVVQIRTRREPPAGVNGCGTGSYNIVSWTVNALPVCGITGTNTICAGQTTSFSASGGTSYSWSGPSGFTANTASTGNITAAGAYNVTVTDGNGCTSSCSRTLTVNALPTPTAGSNSSVCAGSTLNLTSSGGTAYSWTGPNSFTSALQNPSITNVTAAAAGTYTVTVTNASGCTATASTTVAINPRPIPTITGTNSICLNSSSVYTTEAGMSAYLWTVSAGGTITAGTGTNSITVNWTTSGPKTVTVNYTNANGCTAASATSFAVTVNPLPVCGITGTNTICAGQTTSFSASGGTSYSWSGPSGFTANTASTGNITAAGAYNVTVTDGNGCTSSCSRTLTVNALPTPTAGSNSSVCAGSTLNLTSSGGTAYSWTGPNSFTSALQNPSITNVTAAAAGTYTVTVTNASGCTATASTTVAINPRPIPTITGTNSICLNSSSVYTTEAGMSAYLWTVSAGGTITAGTGTNSITVNWTTSGPKTVTVNYTNANGCTAASATSFAVTVNPLPVCGITGTNTICAGQTTSFSASGGTSYSWSGPSGFTTNTASTGNITAAGAYNVTVTDGNGCTSSCSRTLTVNALPTPTAGSNSSVCAGSTLNLTSSGGTAYSWTGPNSFTSALQNPSITNVTAAAAGTYTVTVTNASGCTATASTTVAINPRPIPTITGTNSICLNSSSVYTTEAGMSAYLWTVSAGGTITAGTGTNSITVNWTTSGPKTVTVNYTNANGCTAASASSFAVTVNPLPVCGITGTNTICAGQTTSFSASGGTSYSWSGPSGFTANTASTGNITAAGAYNVTVTDGNGCTSSCSRTLTVNALPTPTAGSNSSVCAGSTLNLTSSGGTAYSWTGPNSFTSALQNPSITNVTAAAAGTYTVTVTNASGCTATASTTVAINPRPISYYYWN
jgi:hypothetical protein